MSTEAQWVAPRLRRRMAAWVYEGILLWGVLAVANAFFNLSGSTGAARPLQTAALLLVAGAYCTWCWSHGQTLAMRTWHIRVVDRDGQRLTMLRAALRYACSLAWFLPPLAFAAHGYTPVQIAVVVGGWVTFWALLSFFLPGRQFLHDIVAGTRLVPTDKPQSGHVEPA